MAPMRIVATWARGGIEPLDPMRALHRGRLMFRLVSGGLLLAMVAAACGDDTTSRIAFVSDRDGNIEIYVMDADGSNVIRLTNNPTPDLFPALSPDGSRIAFTFDRGIYVMEADGSNVIRLTNYPDAFAAWSPDGSRIAFESGRDGIPEIYVMDADGSNVIRLTNNPTRPGPGLVAGWEPHRLHLGS